MSSSRSASIRDHLADLTDPRRRQVVHPLIHIVSIASCAVIAGADDFVSIASRARRKRGWLAEFLDLSAGIPSHDRFDAALAAIKPAEFAKCLSSRVAGLHESTAGQSSLPGTWRTLRRCYSAFDLWCNRPGVCITCTSGDEACCAMIQTCCDCCASMMEAGCTCCLMMNGMPVCCGC